tara:strand:+ start:374 stop:712 length:339 start_codon:yes stop_codon:yes gene_type:complete
MKTNHFFKMGENRMEKEITEFEVTNEKQCDTFAQLEVRETKPTKYKGEVATFCYKVRWIFSYSRFVPKFVDKYAEVTLKDGRVMPLIRVQLKRDTKKFNDLVWSFHKARQSS